MALTRRILLWGSENDWLRERLPRYRFARGAVARFIPGEELGDALAAAYRFAGQGMGTVLTCLGENVRDEAEAAAVADHYHRSLDAIPDGLDCHLSVKLTQLGLDLGAGVARRHVESLLDHAAEKGAFLWIDMEGSAYTDATLELYRAARERHRDVGVCLQANLYRTARDLEELLSIEPAIRLVKGAYAEPRSKAFPRRKDVNANYLRLADRLLRERARRLAAPVIGFATHDTRMIAEAASMAEAAGVPADGFEVQMLYGIRADEQLRLARQGNRVRVLISYGDAWFPWFMRRLAERPANLVFVARNLVPR